jgi:hypothetical protein
MMQGRVDPCLHDKLSEVRCRFEDTQRLSLQRYQLSPVNTGWVIDCRTLRGLKNSVEW